MAGGWAVNFGLLHQESIGVQAGATSGFAEVQRFAKRTAVYRLIIEAPMLRICSNHSQRKSRSGSECVLVNFKSFRSAKAVEKVHFKFLVSLLGSWHDLVKGQRHEPNGNIWRDQPLFKGRFRESEATMTIETIELRGIKMAASSGLIFPAAENATVVRL